MFKQTEMKEYPILFQPDMVSSILAGRKTQTRRIINPQPTENWMDNTTQFSENGNMYDYSGRQLFWLEKPNYSGNGDSEIKSPYGKPGDVIWVRETWKPRYVKGGLDGFRQQYPNAYPWFYAADGDCEKGYGGWKPSIHMPKDACRIYLQNTGVRIQRLQDISEEDAIAEGIACLSKDASFMEKNGRMPTWKYGIADKDGLPGGVGWQWEDWKMSAKDAFRALIEKINGPDIWDQNPWVRAISFRVLSTTGRPDNLEELCAAK